MVNPSAPYQIVTQAVVDYYNGLSDLHYKLLNYGNWFTRLFLSGLTKKRRDYVANQLLPRFIADLGTVMVADEKDISQTALNTFKLMAAIQGDATIIGDNRLPLEIVCKFSNLNMIYITAIHAYSQIELAAAREEFKNKYGEEI